MLALFWFHFGPHEKGSPLSLRFRPSFFLLSGPPDPPRVSWRDSRCQIRAQGDPKCLPKLIENGPTLERVSNEIRLRTSNQNGTQMKHKCNHVEPHGTKWNQMEPKWNKNGTYMETNGTQMNQNGKDGTKMEPKSQNVNQFFDIWNPMSYHLRIGPGIKHTINAVMRERS